MTDEALITVAKKFGTPTYVFDTKSLQERLQKLHDIWGEKVGLCYSIKANPFLIPAMLPVVSHLEVCSPGELSICERLQVPMNQVVYSGVNKEPEDIARAVRDGAGICTAESLRHVRLLQEAAKKAGTKLPVLLRLNSGAQFGMSREDLEEVLHHHAEYPNLSFEGIHYFAGTQRKNKDFHQQKEELQMLREFFAELREKENLPLRKLEYGPGLPVPLFAGADFSDTLAPARELAKSLQEAAGWAELTVEAGRFFATECGTYLTKAMDCKEANGKRYCILDGGIHHVSYLGQIMGMKEPVIRHFRGNGDPDAAPGDVAYRRISDTEPEEALSEWALCGSLCTTNDDLVRARTMTEILPGDVLSFENIGAYSVTEGIYLFLSRKMPGIVLYNDISDIRMVRHPLDTSLWNMIEDAVR